MDSRKNLDDNGQGTSEHPRMWTIEDPFQYAPPESEADSWILLLEPLMKKDKIRCEAWKDEVQNLLIFAGLFSAVVTAFVMESYKNLQPNPNDAMIQLLSHIATHLDTFSDPNSTQTNSSLAQHQLSPSSPTILVNIFWFISLVLSLTTVLVGIVSLQWLREHQSYPDLAPRQHYAVYHMRAEGIAKWHVSKIFAALPLLLQGALILFLLGLVEFLRVLGEWSLTIPVAVVIGLTLLFLVSTTVLPSLQGLSLYLHLSSERSRSDGWKDPATQCPYKSPQSHAFRMLSRPVFRLLFRLYPRVRYFVHDTWHLAIHFFSETVTASLPEDNFSRYIYFAFKTSNWIDFDVAWLSIRDAYMRRSFGRSSWYEELGQRDDDILPIHDIVLGLHQQSHQESTYAPAYYCLSEISELVLLPLDTGDFCYHSAEDRCRQNAYLHDLLCRYNDTCLSDYFVVDPFFDDAGKETKTLTAILHQQNLLSFLGHDHMSGGVLQSMHRKELALRLMQYFYQERSLQLRSSKVNLSFPVCLAFNQFDFRLDREINRDNFNAIAWQFVDVTLKMVRQLDGQDHSDSLVKSIPVQQNALSVHMETASCLTSRAFTPELSIHHSLSYKIDQDIKGAFYCLFSYIEEHLSNEISSWTNSQARPSLMFYIAALYTHSLASWNDQAFKSLHSTLCRYKAGTVDVGHFDSIVETRLLEDYKKRPWMYSSYSTPFSPQWWSDFNHV